MSAVALFAADTHLSDATWTSRGQIVGDSLWGLQQLVDLAKLHEVPLVIAGDCWELMHHPRPSSQTVQSVRKCLSQLQAANLPLYYVNGQHDQLTKPFWFEAIHDWPVHVGGRVFKLGHQDWYGVDYFEPSVADQVYLDIPDVYGVVAHQRWAEFAGSKHFASSSLANIRAEVVVSGDTHQAVEKVGEGGQRWISPGCTHMRSFVEPRIHYAVLMSDDGVSDFVPLVSRPVFTGQVTHEQEFLDNLDVFAESVLTKQQECLDKGVPYEVARPLVIVIDEVGCNPLASMAKLIPEAHIVVQVGKSMLGQDGQPADKLWQPIDRKVGVSEVSELAVSLGKVRKMSEPSLFLLQALVAGKDIYEQAYSLGGRKDVETGEAG